MSFDPNLPTPRDRMRFQLGDINIPELRPDTQYDALLSENDEATATMKMAESLASEYAQNPSSVNVGGVSVSYSTLVQNWQRIADNIRATLKTSVATGGFDSGTLDRPGLYRSESQYRRPLDWYPNPRNGDGW